MNLVLPCSKVTSPSHVMVACSGAQQLAPITVTLKIGLRRLNNCDWDEELSIGIKEQWAKILIKVKDAESITFKRCIKPVNAVGQPDLIIFNDGSELAMCTAAYIRWECTDDSADCRLWVAKTRVTPLQKLTIYRIEAQSAVMGVRLGETIKKNSIWEFNNIYYITDSKCLLATLSKDSVALGEFMGNRVAEILDTTTVKQWYHVASKDNIADLATREKLQPLGTLTKTVIGKEDLLGCTYLLQSGL